MARYMTEVVQFVTSKSLTVWSVLSYVFSHLLVYGMFSI